MRLRLQNLRLATFLGCSVLLTLISIPFKSIAQCNPQQEVGVNLVINGDFEDPTAEFGTEYPDPQTNSENNNFVGGYDCSLGSDCVPPNFRLTQCQCFRNWSMPGEFWVGDDVSLFHFNFGGVTPKGNYSMFVDGDCNEGTKVWCQDVEVIPNTNYYFTASITSLGEANQTLNPDQVSSLRFTVGNFDLSEPLQSSAIVGQWSTHEAVWFSGANSGTMQLCIENTAVAACDAGNDFAIDDISFTGGCAFGDPGPVPDLGEDFSLCGMNLPITLDPGVPAGAGVTFEWSNGATTPTISVSTAGTYSVCVSQNGSCTRSDIINVLDDYTIELGPPLELCNPVSATLNPGYSGPGVTYAWTLDGAPIGGNTQTLEATAPGTYEVTVNDPGCGIRTDQVVVTSRLVETEDIEYCPGDVTLTATGSTTYNFYENENDADAIGTGTTHTVDLSAGGDHTFWVEDGVRTPFNGVGPPGNNLNREATDQGDRRMPIRVSQEMTIEALDIIAHFYGEPSLTGTIRLFAANNTTILEETDPITIASGGQQQVPHTETLGWKIPPGDYYLAISGTLRARWLDNGDGATAFPYTTNDGEGEEIFTLLPTKNGTEWGYDAVYFFHNFDISTGSKCGRVPINVVENCPCAPPSAVITGGGEVCEGVNAPSITITITPGDAANAISWDIVYAIDGVDQPAVNVTDPSLLFVNPAEGEYTITSVAENTPGMTCNHQAVTGTAEVIINPLPEPTLADATVCDGVAEPLNPGTFTSYDWSSGEQTATVNVTTAGAHTVTVTDANGCQEQATMTLTVNALPEPTLADNTTCDGFDVNLDPGAFDSYLWSTGAVSATLDVGTAGPYSVTVSDAIGCEGQATMTLEVNDGPVFTITDDVEMCLGETATLTIGVTGTGPYNVTYNDGNADVDLTGIADGETFDYSGLSTTTFTPVTATDANGCTSTGGTGATVTINPLPTGALTGETTICFGETADLTFTMTGEAPFNIAYLADEDTVPLLGITSPYIETVSPTLTTTYTLVGVMDANGCAAPALEDETVTVEISPSGVLSGDTTICAGETTQLEFQFDSATTFDVVYNDGVTDIPLNGISSGHTFDVTPATTTTYTMISVIASGGATCPGAPDGAPVVTIVPLPDVSITGTTAICDGLSTDLAFVINGDGPFNVVYSDGTSEFNLNGVNDGETVTVTPDSTTTYSLVSVANSTAPGCAGTTDGSEAVVTVNLPPEVVGQSNACLSVNDYETEITISGGDPGSYVVDGSTTGIVGNVFTSTALPNNDPANPHTFLVDDGNGCGPVEVNVNYDCQCVTDVATMDIAPLEACTPDDLSGMWNFADTVMEQGDVSAYILHDNATASAGTILDQNDLGTFSFDDGTMLVNTTYYISAVLGPDQGDGDPDMTSSCTRVAIGTPVLWNPLPTVTVADDSIICIGESAELTFTLAGDGPFEVVYNDGTADVTLSNINSGYVETVTPATSTTYTLVSVTDGSTPVCTGTAVGTVDITVTEPPEFSAITYTCDINKLWYTAEFTVENALAGTFDITGIDESGNAVTGTLTGLNFVSDQITNGDSVTFWINPVSSCSPIPVGVKRFCECDTEVGTMDGTQLDLCQGETAIGTHNGDEFLDANDVMMYVLHDNSTAVLGNILAANSVPQFTFLPAMDYDVVYYISAVAGNDIGDGATVDLVGDKCAQISIGQPLTYSQAPVATIIGDTTICIGSQAIVTIELEGTAPYDFTFNDGTADVDVLGHNSDTYTFTSSPVDTTYYEMIAVTDASAATCPGSVLGQAVANVPGELTIETITSIDPSCDGVCDGVLGAQVDAINDPLVQPGDYAWFDGNGDFIANAQIIQNLCEGDYTVTADNGVCTVSENVSLIAPDPVIADLVGDIDPSCNGFADGSAEVTAQGGTVSVDYTYAWPSTGAATTETGLTAGSYIVSVTDDNGCSDTALAVLVDPSAVLIEITNFDRIVCAGGPAFLTALASGGNPAAYTYYWNGDATIVDASTATAETGPSIPTTYNVSATDANGCPSAVVSEQVDIYGPVAIVADISDTDICQGESVVISNDGGSGGDGNFTISWTPSDGTGDLNGDVDQTVTPIDSSTTYVVTLTDGCNQEATDDVAVTIRPTPQTAFTYEPTIACEFVTLVTANTTPGMTGTETCTWDFKDIGLQSSTCSGATAIYGIEGQHTVVLTVANEYGCSRSATLDTMLFTAPNPDVSFEYAPMNLSMLMSTATFTPSDASGGGSIDYFWDFADGNTDTTETPTHEFPWDSYGEYLVELVGVNEYGCTDTTTQLVIVTGDYIVNAPNAFSPNADGTNDVFNPVGIGLDHEDWAFYVFDRWGDKIFETNNMLEGWDGTIKATGVNAKQDVYTWLLYTSSRYDPSNTEIFRTGRVTVLR